MENFPPRLSRETRPAFAGFIIGAVVLFVILFSIVKLTNAHFDRLEAAAAPAAGASQ